jgi:uncharacterized membrane protein
MAMGPVQLQVIGFKHPKFTGQIRKELDRLRKNDQIRVLDALVAYKDADGVVTTERASDLSAKEAEEFGAVVGALIGLGAAGEEGALLGADKGAEAAGQGSFLDEQDMLDVIEEIPDGSAAAIVLLEHRWAIPLRDAVLDAGGLPLVDTWVHPRDLIEIGLMAAEEAEADEPRIVPDPEHVSTG